MTTATKLTEAQVQVLMHYKNIPQRSRSEIMRVFAILCVDDGFDSATIEKFTDYGRKYALDLRRKYIAQGIDSLNDRKAQEPAALLTKNQRKEIFNNIVTRTPKDFGYNTDFWTAATLGHLILEQYSVRYQSKTSIRLLFKEAKFTFHKPDKHYKNRDQNIINDWSANQKPIIEELLNDENTIVLVEDEMMLSTQTTTQQIWLPQGEFPKVDVSSTRKIRCIYGFLNVQSGKEYAFKALRANSEETCKVLNKIGNIHTGKKIIIIWDNASWHKSAQIKDFLKKTKHSFHLINFPPYAPELNPQEHVWKTGRAQVTHNQFISNIDKASDAFIDYLNNHCFDYRLTL